MKLLSCLKTDKNTSKYNWDDKTHVFQASRDGMQVEHPVFSVAPDIQTRDNKKMQRNFVSTRLTKKGEINIANLYSEIRLNQGCQKYLQIKMSLTQDQIIAWLSDFI